MTFSKTTSPSGSRIYYAIITIPLRYHKGQGKEAIRAIQERSGGWRIDRAEWVGTWTPWEAINSVVYRTASEAKRALTAYTRLRKSGGHHLERR